VADRIPTRDDNPSVSIVVPTHQRRTSVLRLCEALSRQEVAPGEFELVVSIDGSTDRTRESLEMGDFPFPTTIIWRARRGRAGAINAGVAVARGALIILLDDDMEPSPGFVAAHRRAHAGGSRLGVMGAVPVAVDPSASAAERWVADKFNHHLENLARSDYRLLLTDFYSGNFSISRALLDEVGGFDEDFKLYGNEDLELSHRLAHAGIDVRYDAEALAHQHIDKSFAALARDREAEGRTAVLFAEKHPEVFDRLKLGTFHDGPRALRSLRNGMLAVGARWRGLGGVIRGLERIVSRTYAPASSAFYRLALGYFYWAGVRDELRQHGARKRAGDQLARLAADLSA
jgi:GT2 family glycosyltransferase